MSIRYLFYMSLFLFTGLASGFSVRAAEGDLVERGISVINNVERAKQDEYIPADTENLSKLYWAIGKLDLENDEQIDSYLMINECELYLRYYNNDFEWKKIRTAAREHITKDMSDFPTRFEIMSPLGLGRYDPEREEFEVAEDYKIPGLRKLDFTNNSMTHRRICQKTGEIDEYPSNLIIILNRPLILEVVPVKRELARPYIEEEQKYFEATSKNLQMRDYERMSFLRLKVRITQYKNTVSVISGELRAVVFGRLEGYEVYADIEKMKPLFYKDLKSKRFQRLKKESKDVAAKGGTSKPSLER